MENTLYIFGSVAMVSLVSLAGISALLLKEEWLKKTFSFLVSLAVGALLGDAFFHLIPESYEKIKDPTAVSSLIIAGILSFFILEKVLRWRHHEPNLSKN